MNLIDELILTLLNDESGYFHQVQGWNLHCAIAGAAIAELSLLSRIDTDLESLYLVDSAETDDPILDTILKEIADEPEQRNTQFWIERLTPHAELIIDSTLERLEKRGVLTHHDGGFWTISLATWRTQSYSPEGGEAMEFVKTRISKVIFDNEIPDPRDIIIICLVQTCDVFRFMFPMDETAQERVDAVCKMDVIGRAIAQAVSESIAGPSLQRPVKTRPIPTVPLRELLFNPHIRDGNTPAIFASLAEKHGPVFELRSPFAKTGVIILAGIKTNEWVHRSGRNFLRTKDYLEGFVGVYGASRVLPSLDGADHFRLRKTYGSIYQRTNLENRLGEMYRHARSYLEGWKTGDVLPALTTFCQLMNAQFSQLTIGIDTQDCIDELLEFKKRALAVHVMQALPEFMLNTPGMKRRKKHVAELVKRVQAVHTPAQRIGCPRDLADDLLGLHNSDPQFLPETDIPFAFVSPLLASFYLGSSFSFAVYSMMSRPDLYDRIREEADAFFADGEPGRAELDASRFDVTHRVIMETMRMYPIVPINCRNVMNTCVVEGYELPLGRRIYVAQTATHYMEEFFPDPFTFDIDRYLPERQENVSRAYAPYGLGTHTCLGSRWMELQLALNLLLIAYYFRIELTPKDYKLRINPIPSQAPSKKFSFTVAEKRRELPS